MITIPNARRAHTPHAPLPHRITAPDYCPHGEDYCTQCMPEGLVIHQNKDIERRACLGPHEGNA